MKSLGSVYGEFEFIDVDAQGGYARVAHTKALKAQNDRPSDCAFKVMRPVKNGSDWYVWFQRFVDEIKILNRIFDDKDTPNKILEMLTPIYDYGFVSTELLESLSQYKEPNYQSKIQQFTDLSEFINQGKKISRLESEKWCPYIVEEIVAYDDSLYRQIHKRPHIDSKGLFRLPTGEVVHLALQLLDLVEYLYDHLEQAYLDWKPEHVYWNGKTRKVKLIDWNVTIPLKDDGGREQNMQNDLRNFCGAVIYTSLTMVDITTGKPIGPKPSTHHNNPVKEIRDRWSTEDPVFYQSSRTLDENIKTIIRNGLNPNLGYKSPKDLRNALLIYSRSTGIEIDSEDGSSSQAYWLALEEIRSAQVSLREAFDNILEATKRWHNENDNQVPLEYKRLQQVLKETLDNLLTP